MSRVETLDHNFCVRSCISVVQGCCLFYGLILTVLGCFLLSRCRVDCACLGFVYGCVFVATVLFLSGMFCCV